MPPLQFIPLAEETGLIVPLGRWVLREATRQLAAWHSEIDGAGALTMAINVSARQMHDRQLVDDVRAAVSDAGVSAAHLVLEVTESMLLHDADAVIAILGELKAVGLRIAIDDFGTGYASLSYLRRLPVDILKVDKSFLTTGNVAARAEEESLLVAILNLGKTLGLRTVAEGIERRDQLTPLQRGGCDLGQGFLFAKPLTADASSALLRRVAVPAQLARNARS